MMKAAREGHADCILVLLAAGAETKWADLDGFSALVYGAMWGHEEVVRVILESLRMKRIKVKALFQDIDVDRSGLLDRGMSSCTLLLGAR